MKINAKNLIERLKIYAVYIVLEIALIGAFFGFGGADLYDKVYTNIGLMPYSEYLHWWYSSDWRMLISVVITGICFSIAVDMGQLLLHEFGKMKKTDN